MKFFQSTEEKTVPGMSAVGCTVDHTKYLFTGFGVQRGRWHLVRAWALVPALVLHGAGSPLKSREEDGLWYERGCLYQQSYHQVTKIIKSPEGKMVSGMSMDARTSGRTTYKKLSFDLEKCQ